MVRTPVVASAARPCPPARHVIQALRGPPRRPRLLCATLPPTTAVYAHARTRLPDPVRRSSWRGRCCRPHGCHQPGRPRWRATRSCRVGRGISAGSLMVPVNLKEQTASGSTAPSLFQVRLQITGRPVSTDWPMGSTSGAPCEGRWVRSGVGGSRPAMHSVSPVTGQAPHQPRPPVGHSPAHASRESATTPAMADAANGRCLFPHGQRPLAQVVAARVRNAHHGMAVAVRRHVYHASGPGPGDRTAPARCRPSPNGRRPAPANARVCASRSAAEQARHAPAAT
jgi:hypothetical protein